MSCSIRPESCTHRIPTSHPSDSQTTAVRTRLHRLRRFRRRATNWADPFCRNPLSLLWPQPCRNRRWPPLSRNLPWLPPYRNLPWPPPYRNPRWRPPCSNLLWPRHYRNLPWLRRCRNLRSASRLGHRLLRLRWLHRRSPPPCAERRLLLYGCSPGPFLVLYRTGVCYLQRVTRRGGL